MICNQLRCAILLAASRSYSAFGAPADTPISNGCVVEKKCWQVGRRGPYVTGDATGLSDRGRPLPGACRCPFSRLELSLPVGLCLTARLQAEKLPYLGH
jgi:hypothetical protein